MPDVDPSQPQSRLPSNLWKRQPYLSYLLRLWQENVDGRPCWRASLESVQTGRQITFVHWEQVIEFLVQEQRTEETINRTG